jgi:hypothetical protein
MYVTTVTLSWSKFLQELVWPPVKTFSFNLVKSETAKCYSYGQLEEKDRDQMGSLQSSANLVWEILKKDSMNMFATFQQAKLLLFHLNCGTIVLHPKKANAIQIRTV